jgi:hypothetical protein
MEQAELAEIDASNETTPAPVNAEELLGLAKSLIADNLLTPTQLAVVQNAPREFLRSLLWHGALSPEQASAQTAIVEEVVDALVRAYFQSLLAKASEGEKYDDARLKKALLKAQVSAVEALENALNGASADQVVQIAHELKD